MCTICSATQCEVEVVARVSLRKVALKGEWTSSTSADHEGIVVDLFEQ